MEWIELKNGVVAATGLSRDTLHLFFGCGSFALMALLLRSATRTVVPWLTVLALSFANEALDLMASSAFKGHLDWGASLHDLGYTLLLPTLLMVGHRLLRRVPPSKAQRDAAWRRARLARATC